ncbi:hypothetical protein KIPB_015579, partial [Kipferlia bialata]
SSLSSDGVLSLSGTDGVSVGASGSAYTLPAAKGTEGQVLSLSDDSGTVAWADAASGSTDGAPTYTTTYLPQSDMEYIPEYAPVFKNEFTFGALCEEWDYSERCAFTPDMFPDSVGEFVGIAASTCSWGVECSITLVGGAGPISDFATAGVSYYTPDGIN